MPRIKNYTAKHDTADNPYTWEHDSRQIKVSVVQQDTKYSVYVTNHQRKSQRQVAPISDDKNEVRKVAVSWMKNNPFPMDE